MISVHYCSLHLTTFCLQYRPSIVACVCIYLASKWSNWKVRFHLMESDKHVSIHIISFHYGTYYPKNFFWVASVSAWLRPLSVCSLTLDHLIPVGLNLNLVRGHR